MWRDGRIDALINNLLSLGASFVLFLITGNLTVVSAAPQRNSNFSHHETGGGGGGGGGVSKTVILNPFGSRNILMCRLESVRTVAAAEQHFLRTREKDIRTKHYFQTLGENIEPG